MRDAVGIIHLGRVRMVHSHYRLSSGRIVGAFWWPGHCSSPSPLFTALAFGSEHSEMTNTKNTVSDERLDMLLRGAKVDAQMQTSARYNREAEEMVSILTHYQSLRSQPDPAGVRVKGLEEAKKRMQEALDLHDAEVADHLANESERADLWTDIDVLVDDLRTILSALTEQKGEADESAAAAIEIADAVIAWMVRHDLLDADHEYRDDDIVAVLDDLVPPSNQEPVAVTDDMVEQVFQAVAPHIAGTDWREVRAALTAALSVKPQSGENG